MIRYKIINNYSNIEDTYLDLLASNDNLYILNKDNKHLVLTKEKSIFEIDNIENFLNKENANRFYKTIIADVGDVKRCDLDLYFSYLDKNKNKMMQKYGNYLFGSIAVKSDNKFITTIRGKKDFSSYAIVSLVDHNNRCIYANKKATLNAPLLDTIFQNDKVKVIVHINHYFDDSLPYYEYELPGSVRDSMRDNTRSFNIKYHGVFYLYDEIGNLIT